jgi:glycosyltransferase involved in cell wall biosynthesis
LKFPLSLPRPIIASVGALTSFKRHDLAIRAVSKLQKGSLVIVGKGEEYESLNSMGKELLGDKFSIISVPFSSLLPGRIPPRQDQPNTSRALS